MSISSISSMVCCLSVHPVRQVFCVAELPRLSEFWQVLVAVASGLLLLGAICGFLQASRTTYHFGPFGPKDGEI